MRPRFQRDPAARHSPEHFLHRLRSCAQSLLQHDFALFIQHAIPTRTIAQIETDRQLLLRKIPVLLHCCGANLLHCRSPFYLCFEHVDNLGAYSIPSETGLLIPSDFVNYAAWRTCQAYISGMEAFTQQQVVRLRQEIASLQHKCSVPIAQASHSIGHRYERGEKASSPSDPRRITQYDRTLKEQTTKLTRG